MTPERLAAFLFNLLEERYRDGFKDCLSLQEERRKARREERAREREKDLKCIRIEASIMCVVVIVATIILVLIKK